MVRRGRYRVSVVPLSLCLFFLVGTPGSVQGQSNPLGGISTGIAGINNTIGGINAGINNTISTINGVTSNPLGTIGGLAGVPNLPGIVGGGVGIYNQVQGLINTFRNPGQLLGGLLGGTVNGLATSIFSSAQQVVQQASQFSTNVNINLNNIPQFTYGLAGNEGGGNTASNFLSQPTDSTTGRGNNSRLPTVVAKLGSVTGPQAFGGGSAATLGESGLSAVNRASERSTIDTANQLGVVKPYSEKAIAMAAQPAYNEAAAIAAVSPVLSNTFSTLMSQGISTAQLFLQDEQVLKQRALDGDLGAKRILDCIDRVKASGARGQGGRVLDPRAIYDECKKNPAGTDGRTGASPQIPAPATGALGADRPQPNENCLAVSLCEPEFATSSGTAATVNTSASQRLDQQRAICAERINFIHKFFGDVCCSVQNPAGPPQPNAGAADILSGTAFTCRALLPNYKSTSSTATNPQDRPDGVMGVLVDETKRRYQAMLLSLKARCDCENDASERVASAFSVPQGYPFNPSMRCGNAMTAAMAQVSSSTSGGAGGGATATGQNCYVGISGSGKNHMFWDAPCEGWQALMRSVSSSEVQFQDLGEAFYKYLLKNRIMQRNGEKALGQNDIRPCSVLDPINGEWSYDRLWGNNGLATTRPSDIPEPMSLLFIVANATTYSYIWWDIRSEVLGFLENRIAGNNQMGETLKNHIDQILNKANFWERYQAYLVKLKQILEYVRVSFLSETGGSPIRGGTRQEGAGAAGFAAPG